MKRLMSMTPSNLYVSLDLIFFFFLFRATPAAYGRSQARDLIRATAADLHHSHNNT